jgi:hypothetical protein
LNAEIANLPRTSEDAIMEITELHQREKPPSAFTTTDKKIVVQQNRRLNCLQRKVAQQRRILNRAQERELKMKTDIELCKNRIVQLELQVHNRDHVHHSVTWMTKHC